jgi:ribosomal protein L31
MKEIIIKCGDCSKEFPTKSYKKKYCPCCAELRRVERQKAFNEKKRLERLAKKYGNAKLVEDAKAAKELGISYGQYKAMPEKVKLKKKMELTG